MEQQHSFADSVVVRFPQSVAKASAGSKPEVYAGAHPLHRERLPSGPGIRPALDLVSMEADQSGPAASGARQRGPRPVFLTLSLVTCGTPCLLITMYPSVQGVPVSL